MRSFGFFFGGASFGRRRPARRLRGAAHRLAAEALEGRAVLAVLLPPPTITGVTDDNGAVLRSGAHTSSALLTVAGGVATGAATVTVFNGNTPLGNATVTGGTWSFEVASPQDGTYNFRARAVSGEATSPATARPFRVTVDTVAPDAPTIGNVFDDRAPIVGSVPRGGSTNDRTLSLSGSAEAGSRVEVFADTGAGPVSLGRAAVVGATWRFTTRPFATDGEVTFTAQATDRAGNSSGATVAPYWVTIDTAEAAPVITEIIDNFRNNPADPADELEEDVKPRQISNDRTLVIKGTANPGSSVRILDGGTRLGTVRADATTGDWSFTTRPLTDGKSYQFVTRAIDAAGNASGLSAAARMLIDATAPVRPLITSVVDTGGTSVLDQGATNQTTLVIYGRSEPGRLLPGGAPPIPTTVRVFDGGTLLGDVTTATGEWSFVASGLTEGVHAFFATATDGAGNESVLPSATFTVTVDTTPPPPPTIDPVVSPSPFSVPVLSGTFEPGSIVSVYDGTPGPFTFLGYAATYGDTWGFIGSTGLPDGTHELNVTATDAVGNESAPTICTLVVDTTSPVFTGFGTPLPADGTYGVGAPIFIPVQFDEPVFVDPFGGVPRIPLNTVPSTYATYQSGSGTDTLMFLYVPQLGDTSTDLDFSADAIDLNGGTITDEVGNPLDLALPTPGAPGSFGALTAIAVNAVLTFDPSAVLPTGVVSGTSPGPIQRGPLSAITITFNAPVTGFSGGSFEVFYEGGSLTSAGVMIEDLGGDSYRLTLPAWTLPGLYRLDIGGPSSGIQSGGILMDTVVSLYWQFE